MSNNPSKRVFAGTEMALVMLDLNPFVSEPIRFGVLFSLQAMYNNVLISALSFGAITLLLDAFGALATADLLDNETAAKLTNKANSIIKKVGLSRLLNIKTSIIGDLSITLLVGTPITLILKQRQQPTRSRKENIILGFALSASASLISAIQGGAIVAGLWHPSFLTDTLAVLALASILLTANVLKKYFMVKASSN